MDRSYKLAGSTIRMEEDQIERMGSNQKINKKLLESYPPSAAVLKDMQDTIKELRIPRNKVAHQAGFSNQNLCVLQTIENAKTESISIKEITDRMSYDNIKEMVSDESIEQYENVLLAIDKLVTDLINSLSPVYTSLIQSKSPVES